MAELTSEIQAVLEEYTQLQQEEQKLKERKQGLQEQLKAHLRGDEKTVWYPEVGGTRLKVSCRSAQQVEYDEEKLRARLGPLSRVARTRPAQTAYRTSNPWKRTGAATRTHWQSVTGKGQIRR